MNIHDVNKPFNKMLGNLPFLKHSTLVYKSAVLQNFTQPPFLKDNYSISLIIALEAKHLLLSFKIKVNWSNFLKILTYLHILNLITKPYI